LQRPLHLALVACALTLSFSTPSRADDIKLKPSQLTPGSRIDLTGQWHYKPGYAIGKDESPEKPGATAEGYVSIPVPQILNKIYWWLDDSEDFKRDEDARLKKLGFDTDKAEDGWYRKVIELPDSGLPKGARVFVQFDGVAMRSDVYINGVKLGHHDGMFSRFEYDLTPHLKAGKNVLAAFVSMEKIPPNEVSMGEAVTVNLTASKVLTMSKGMFGPLSPGFPNRAYDLHGIWQPVRLVVCDALRITDVWFQPSLDGAKVAVEADAPGSGNAELIVELTDPATSEVTQWTGPLARKATGISKAVLGGKGLKPKLWTPAEPNLYRLSVTLQDGPSVDQWTKMVGFRTFEVKGNQLLLNGKPYWSRGANQLPYGKNPTDPAVAHKLIQYLHDSNIRVTRTHATPWNEAWLDAADEIGLGVSVEGMRPWGLAGNIGPTPPAMMKHWLDEQADVVKRLRNHPSVLIHTIGNEMMLRDDDNLEKWKQISEVAKLTRELDPFRPVVISSSYVRAKKQYDELLAPNEIDDGDIDDPHSYKSWYGNSPFVLDSKFETDFKRRGEFAKTRPYMGQEFATGYPDLDTGLPTMRYTRDLMTPQAWVGVYAYPGNDPKWFLEYQRAVTKRWIEQLRFQREGKTAGFSMFSAECWFSHSYDANRAKPYPVLEAVKQAYAPVAAAIETNRRRFCSDEKVDAGIFVTNDDEQGRDFKGFVQPAFLDRENRVGFEMRAEAVEVPYYSTRHMKSELLAPTVEKRQKMELQLKLLEGPPEKQVGLSTDPVEIFPKLLDGPIKLDVPVQLIEVPGSLVVYSASSAAPKVILVGSKGGAKAIDEVMPNVEGGATAILFSPDMQEMLKRFPDDIYDDAKVGQEDFERRVAEAKQKKTAIPKKPKDGFAFDMKKDIGEFVDWTPARATKLVEGLEPMDLRWWGRKNDWRAFVSTGSFRLKPTGKARELFRYIPAHGYISAEKVPWQMRTVLFEIPVGKGRLWVCNLELAESVGVDPVADIVFRNLVTAAADPNSTANLKGMPSHEEMLKGKLPN
jgi:hypothetical protein